MRMTKSKKYDYRITEDNTNWTAEIIRRITTRKIGISKRQNGFPTKSDAQAWGEKELSAFLQSLTERNKRRAEKRK